jgi:hypothetical protein
MKKLFFILGLFLSLSLQGQVLPGILTSSGAVSGGGPSCTQNLLTWSEELNRGSSTPWEDNGNVTVTAINSANDLNGQATLETLTITWSNALFGHPIISVTAGLTYRFSFEVKRGTATEMKYNIVNHNTYTDIVAPTSYYSQTNASTPVRVSVEFTAPTGCTQVELWILNGSSENGTLYVGRAQLETNGSCYVKTEGTIITP